jgi:hypothetical protein
MIRELNNKKPLASNVGAVTSTPGTLPIDIQKLDDKNDDDEDGQFRKFSKVILASLQRRLGSRKQAEALVHRSDSMGVPEEKVHDRLIHGQVISKARPGGIMG